MPFPEVGDKFDTPTAFTEACHAAIPRHESWRFLYSATQYGAESKTVPIFELNCEFGKDVNSQTFTGCTASIIASGVKDGKQRTTKGCIVQRVQLVHFGHDLSFTDVDSARHHAHPEVPKAKAGKRKSKDAHNRHAQRQETERQTARQSAAKEQPPAAVAHLAAPSLPQHAVPTKKKDPKKVTASFRALSIDESPAPTGLKASSSAPQGPIDLSDSEYEDRPRKRQKPKPTQTKDNVTESAISRKIVKREESPQLPFRGFGMSNNAKKSSSKHHG